MFHSRLINYFRSGIVKWGRKNFSDFPWRHTENRWHALVAEIMLQRTNAEQVLPVYKSFCKKYVEPGDFLKDRRARVFSSLGLLWREEPFRDLQIILSSQKIPCEKNDLLKLPCIGDYVASSFRSLHLNLRDVIIDSNVVRIYGRYFGFETDGETRRKKWFIDLSRAITPVRTFRDFNYGVIDFTREVCTPSSHCIECILKRRCSYFRALKKSNS